MTTPTQVPTSLIAGDTWVWQRDLADYPASVWSSVWYFQKADANFSVAGVASGDTHTATVTAANSVTKIPGKYRWQLVVTASGVRKTVEEGRTEVMPDPAVNASIDYRTTARIVLDTIDTYLRDPTNLQASSYSLGGRSLSRWSRADLLVEREKWKAEAAGEEAAAKMAQGLGNPRRLYVRFERGS